MIDRDVKPANVIKWFRIETDYGDGMSSGTAHAFERDPHGGVVSICSHRVRVAKPGSVGPVLQFGKPAPWECDRCKGLARDRTVGHLDVEELALAWPDEELAS